MSKPLLDYYNEKVEFSRLPDCAEKVQLAITRLENPYNISEEDRLMYQDYLGKDAAKAVPEIIDKNLVRMFPMLVKYRTIKKGNVAKFTEYAQQAKKMDILSYLLNAGNDLRFHPKELDIAPKFTPGKSDNSIPQQLPDYESLRVGDVVWLGIKPMPWIVLEKKDGKALVISKYVFDCQAYHSIFYKVKWNDTSICKWLNGEYAERYFTQLEKEKIHPVYIDKEATLFMEEKEDTVKNTLFFLSIEESVKYFKTPQDRTARITAFGKRKIMWATFDVYAHWWLRSLTQDVLGKGTTYVRLDGEIQNHGGYILSNSYDEFYDHFGVRPAMYLNLE